MAGLFGSSGVETNTVTNAISLLDQCAWTQQLGNRVSLDADGPRADAYSGQFAFCNPSANGRFANVESLCSAFHREKLLGHVATSVL
jgi:hypothetical protein